MPMNLEIYRELCDAARSVLEVADRYSDRHLGEWRHWAQVLIAGLYDSKRTRRAAYSALLEVDVCEGASAFVVVATAAALVATGSYRAIDGDEDAARNRISAARILLRGLTPQRDEARRDANSNEQGGAPGPKGEARTEHLVACRFCGRRFELFAAPWCRHGQERSAKECPFCRQCSCGDPRFSDPRLWVTAPLAFRRHGFRRLFIDYL